MRLNTNYLKVHNLIETFFILRIQLYCWKVWERWRVWRSVESNNKQND